MPQTDPTHAIFNDFMQVETFSCFGCKRELQKAYSDDVALAEARANYPGADMSETITLCDDCFNAFNSLSNQLSSQRH
jgi:hypothetical protein